MAVTLEQLNLNDLISSSTYIVRGHVAGSVCTQPGGLAFTQYELRIREVLQGNPAASPLHLALPGCQQTGRVQTFSGVPTPVPGVEYVFFLWRGNNGLLQLVGMSQGLLEVLERGNAPVAARAPIDGVMVSRKSGFPVRDHGVRVTLSRLRATIAAASKRSGVDR